MIFSKPKKKTSRLATSIGSEIREKLNELRVRIHGRSCHARLTPNVCHIANGRTGALKRQLTQSAEEGTLIDANLHGTRKGVRRKGPIMQEKKARN